jgi:hypothetical protein
VISIFYLPFQILLSKILIRYPPPICRYEDVKSAGSHQDETRAVASVTGGSHKLVRSQVRQAILEHAASPSGPENRHTDTRMNPPPLHTRPLTQSGKIFSGEASCAEAGGQLQGRGRARKSTTEEREVSNYVRFCLNPYLLPRRGLASAYGCPEAFDAPLPIITQPLPPIPIPNKGRNAELFHFCKRLNLHGPVETDVPTVHNVLAPYIGAIDGLDQPKLIRDGYRPWMANSPFMAYTAILSSSGYQAEARLLDVSTHVETIAIKVEIIKIINEYLKTSLGTVSDEAIAAVNHLLINEASCPPCTSRPLFIIYG